MFVHRFGRIGERIVNVDLMAERLEAPDPRPITLLLRRSGTSP
jgi:hypothetical protein